MRGLPDNAAEMGNFPISAVFFYEIHRPWKCFHGLWKKIHGAWTFITFLLEIHNRGVEYLQVY